MKSGPFRARRWISLGLLLVMALSFALPTFALPSVWYKKIYVTKNPSKMIYEIGESFDPAGMEISGDVYDSDGKYKQTNLLGLSSLTVSPSSFSKAGKQKVTLGLYCMSKSGSKDWLYTTLTITVNEAGDGPTEWYTDIFVASQPKKLVYTVGESFKTSGLSLSGHTYNALDNKKHTVTKLSLKSLKISPTKFTKAGKQNVKLSLYLLGKSGEYKWFSTTVQVVVEKGAVVITKHPTGETVNEGGSCSFIARADNDDSRHWYFTKNGVVVDAADTEGYFPGLKVSGTNKEQLKLSHIPLSMNGWSAYCTFYGKDGSVSSNRAGIVVLGTDPTSAPVTEAPQTEVPPEAVETTPQPTQEPVSTAEPPVTEAPTTPEPVATDMPAPAVTPEPPYAEGVHCTVNGRSRFPVEGDTLLICAAEEIGGFVFDHWEINGEPDFESGPVASFVVSEATVIRAYYHERRVLRTVNCCIQLLTQKDNASGTKYTEFDFEDPYFNPVIQETCPGGAIDCYVTAVIPRKAKVDYWLINGVKYQFPENDITKFRILGLNEATTIEAVFKGMTPSYGLSRDPRAEELEYQAPHVMRCINCWGQFMNEKEKPSGREYPEFDFDGDYVNPVTGQQCPGGLLDIFLGTKPPRGSTVSTWIINDVWYQFPQTVKSIRVQDLDEATLYEVLYKGVTSALYPAARPGH